MEAYHTQPWAWNRLCRSCFRTVSRTRSYQWKQWFIFRQIQASPLNSFVFEQWNPSPDTRAMAYGSWRPPLPRAVELPSTKDRMKKPQFRVVQCVLTFPAFVQEICAGTIKNWIYVPSTILIPSQCLSDRLQLSQRCYLEKHKTGNVL
jgi:hypothetical protein